MEAAPAPATAVALPQIGDPGMRFGYNDGLEAGSPKFALLPASGSDMIRLRLSWNRVERERGTLDWSMFDDLYAQLLATGIRPLWVVVEAPCWAGDPELPCTPDQSAGAPGPENAADIARFSAAVAQRYPESLGIELGNEVNDSTFWPNGQDPAAYAELLRASAVAVHDVDADMPLVAGGLAPFEVAGEGEVPWRDYVTAIVEGGAAEEIDAFAFHPYARLERGEEPGAAVGALVDGFQAQLESLGAGSVPTWVTEVGLSTVSRPPTTPEEQAAGLVSILRGLGERGVPVVVVHRLVDEAVADFPLEAGFGVIGGDNRTPKPAYCALAAERGVPCG